MNLSSIAQRMVWPSKDQAQLSPSGKSTEPQGRSISRVWQGRLAGFLLICSVLSGLATYAALTETPPLGNDPDTVIWLLNLDLIILLMLFVLIARRIVGLWSGRKRGLPGSHLHVRLVYTFSVLAAAPAIIMTIFSAFFFHFGVQTWFSERVQTAVNESQAVAQAYLEEHKQVIRADTLAMAGDLDRQAAFLIGNELAFNKTVQTQSLIRNLSEALVFDTSGKILARSGLTFTLEYEDVPPYAVRRADEGGVVVMTGGNDDRVRALVKLNNFISAYLFVGRMVDPKVLSHLAATKQASEDYADLQARYSDFQVTVTMIFVLVGLVLISAAIWFGLMLARQLVGPISTLIKTADRVRGGDLTARVPENEKLEEFDFLARAFNRMTKQIQEQQGELMKANRQLDRRRRFTETILTGVSSGVIGVDAAGIIHLANSSALDLMGISSEESHNANGLNIEDIIPEIAALLEQAHARPEKMTQAEIPIMQKEGSKGKRTFLIRIVVELLGEEDIGAVLTFDDITELQSAQRKAAWSDVARRIAHEIKNPLTPIQLSAERLRRKYLNQIKDDPETFSQCTDTIIRHVEDIGRMVDEFSSFARMPEPVMKLENMARHVEETLFLHKQAHPEMRFTFSCETQDSTVLCDAGQVRQALNNLIQNAVDSVLATQNKAAQKIEGSLEILMIRYGNDGLALIFSDNGAGLPEKENPDLLTEPYVTHKPKGTGLGLAIVKKIMEDHGGRIVLGVPEWLKSISKWRDAGGATIVLIFPFAEDHR